MGSVRASPEGARIELEDYEVGLLKQLLDEMRTLLEADIPKVDPVMGRLFPEAYEDPGAQRAYSELVDSELRAAKLAALDAVGAELERGESLLIETDAAHNWLTLITDLRLAIGTRLGVTQEQTFPEPEDDGEDDAAYSVFHWLGWFQEALLRASDPEYEELSDHERPDEDETPGG